MWGKLLAGYSGEELAFGFGVAAERCEYQPKPADVLRPILDRRFASDYAWVLAGLRVHGAEWRDVPAVLGELKRIPGMGPEDYYPREVVALDVKAPEIPEHIGRVLEVFGHGDRASALRELSAHPDAGGKPVDLLRTRRELDSAFRAAWESGRGREG